LLSRGFLCNLTIFIPCQLHRTFPEPSVDTAVGVVANYVTICFSFSFSYCDFRFLLWEFVFCCYLQYKDRYYFLFQLLNPKIFFYVKFGKFYAVSDFLTMKYIPMTNKASINACIRILLNSFDFVVILIGKFLFYYTEISVLQFYVFIHQGEKFGKVFLHISSRFQFINDYILPDGRQVFWFFPGHSHTRGILPDSVWFLLPAWSNHFAKKKNS